MGYYPVIKLLVQEWRGSAFGNDNLRNLGSPFHWKKTKKRCEDTQNPTWRRCGVSKVMKNRRTGIQVEKGVRGMNLELEVNFPAPKHL